MVSSGAPSLILFCYLYYMIWVLNKITLPIPQRIYAVKTNINQEMLHVISTIHTDNTVKLHLTHGIWRHPYHTHFTKIEPVSLSLYMASFFFNPTARHNLNNSRDKKIKKSYPLKLELVCSSASSCCYKRTWSQPGRRVFLTRCRGLLNFYNRMMHSAGTSAHLRPRFTSRELKTSALTQVLPPGCTEIEARGKATLRKMV